VEARAVNPRPAGLLAATMRVAMATARVSTPVALAADPRNLAPAREVRR
jgi:hypothetical protein